MCFHQIKTNGNNQMQQIEIQKHTKEPDLLLFASSYRQRKIPKAFRDLARASYSMFAMTRFPLQNTRTPAVIASATYMYDPLPLPLTNFKSYVCNIPIYIINI